MHDETFTDAQLALLAETYRATPELHAPRRAPRVPARPLSARELFVHRILSGLQLAADRAADRESRRGSV
jgi:hypothetical protein